MYVFSDTSSTSSTPGDKKNCQIIQKQTPRPYTLTVGGSHGGNDGDTSSVHPSLQARDQEVNK